MRSATPCTAPAAPWRAVGQTWLKHCKFATGGTAARARCGVHCCRHAAGYSQTAGSSGTLMCRMRPHAGVHSDNFEEEAQPLERPRGGRAAATLGLGEAARAQLFRGRGTAPAAPGMRTADEIKAAYGRPTGRRRAPCSFLHYLRGAQESRAGGASAERHWAERCAC